MRARSRVQVVSCLLAGVVGAGVAPLASGQDDGPSGSRPAFAGRVAAKFDFEEQRTNPLPVPLHWVRAQNDPAVRERPGFPIWNEATLDYESPAFRGEGSVRLPVEGGSASLRLDPGVIPIFADGEYLVTTRVRTESCTHAAARLVARLLDADANPIDLPTITSDPIRTRGQWRQLSVRLPGRVPGAAFVQIDLELVQPRELLGPTYDDSLRVIPEDFGAAAWFDDVEVIQLPRIEISSAAPGHVVLAPDTPEISVLVQDLTSERLNARVVLYDDRGGVVDTKSYPVSGGRDPFVWKPEVERFGWYRAGLEVWTERGRVGSSFIDLLYLAKPLSGLADSPGANPVIGDDRRRFVLLLDDLPSDLTADLAPAVRAAGAGGVSLPLWTESLLYDDLQTWLDTVSGLIDQLSSAWVEVELAFPRLPSDLASDLRMDRHAVVEGIASHDDRLDRYLGEALDRFGQRVDWWRLSSPGDLQPGDDRWLRDRLTEAGEFIRSLAPGARVSLGWRADQQPPSWASDGTIRRFEVMVPRGVGAASFGEIIGAWGGGDRVEGPELTLVVEPPEVESVGARAVADAVLKRGVEAWAVLDHRADELGLFSPWVRRVDEAADPSPALAAFRTLSDQLVGRRVTGSWNLGPGVRCLILSPVGRDGFTRSGAIAIWADGPEGEGRVLRAMLAQGAVRAVDVYGNARTIEPSLGGETHFLEHEVVVSGSPVFIEGVDSDLVTLQASLRLNPAVIQSTPGDHRHTIEFFNPSGRELAGRAAIISPGDLRPGRSVRERVWSVTPRVQQFRALPGDWAELPVEFSFQPVVEAGPMELVVDLLIESDSSPTWLRARAPIELGLDTFDIDAALRVSPDGRDVLIEVTMTNTSDAEIQLEATAFAPGYPRLRMPTVLLEPGQTITRLTNAMVDGASRLGGQTISIAVVERDTRARLNKSVPVP